MSFQKVWNNYLLLKEKLEAEYISLPEFKRAASELRFQDSDSTWWQIRAEDGAWMNWNGTEWVAGNPQGLTGGGSANRVSHKVDNIISQGEPASLLELLRRLAKNLLRSLGKKVVISIVIALLVWFAHTFLMAYVNDGFQHVKNPLLAMVLSLERGKQGGILFWTLLSGLFTCVFAAVRSSGFKSFMMRLKSTPAVVGKIVTQGEVASPLYILAGGALAILLSFIYAHQEDYVANRLVSIMLVMAIILTLTNGQKSIIHLIVRLAWQDLVKIFPSQVRYPYSRNKVNLLLIGAASGFLLSALLPFMPWSGYLALALIIGLTVAMYTKKVSSTAILCWCALAAVSALLLASREVLACYGGFHEYGGTLEAWLSRDGGRAGYVMSLGLMPALGAVAGYLVPLAASDLENLPLEDTADESPPASAEPPATENGAKTPVSAPSTDKGSRSEDDILANPQLHDKITDINGKDWVYYKPAGDQAPSPFWVSREDYDWEQKQMRTGLVWDNKHGWVSTADLAEYKKADDRWQKELEESRKRGAEEIRLAAEKRAEEKRLSDEAAALAYKERYEAALTKRDQGMTDSEFWSNRAQFLDMATNTAEMVKRVADKSIDVLAEVTGPTGKSIKKAYKAASAFAGGISEGMATGKWADSMTDAAGTMTADLVEDKINSDRYKKAYAVFREGAANSWQEGRKVYREGGDYSGSAALAFLEGAAKKTSSEISEALKDGNKFLYQMGEKGVKEAYATFKAGGTTKDTLLGAGRGTLEGTVDASVDILSNELFDHLLPEKGARSSDIMAQQQSELIAAGKVPLAEGLNADWAPVYIHDQAREELLKIVIDTATDYVKGDTFQIDPGI